MSTSYKLTKVVYQYTKVVANKFSLKISNLFNQCVVLEINNRETTVVDVDAGAGKMGYTTPSHRLANREMRRQNSRALKLRTICNVCCGVEE
jgi:hypothetical protein